MKHASPGSDFQMHPNASQLVVRVIREGGADEQHFEPLVSAAVARGGLVRPVTREDCSRRLPSRKLLNHNPAAATTSNVVQNSLIDALGTFGKTCVNKSK